MLTPRQTQILRLLWDGFTRKEIADKIKLAVRVVAREIELVKHLARAGTQAVMLRWALSQGYLSAKQPPRCKTCGRIL